MSCMGSSYASPVIPEWLSLIPRDEIIKVGNGEGSCAGAEIQRMRATMAEGCRDFQGEQDEQEPIL